MSGKRVHVVSLGCPKARVDVEVMVGLMGTDDVELTADPTEADAIVINTCSFLQSAIDESNETIAEMAETKRADSKLVVTGCLPSRFGDQLADQHPEVDTFLGTSDIHRIREAVNGVLPERAYIRQGRSHLYEDLDSTRVVTTRGATAFLKLAEGCNRVCSFCIIPKIRGKQRSRPLDVLVAEARRLADAGIKELVLVAQDLTSYGTDLRDKRMLVKLIDALEAIDGIEWIRLMYAYPWNFTDELLERLAAGGKLQRYVDMPLQHVSARVLTEMRRNTTRDAQRRLIDRLRDIDGMVLRTTFIAGFPGETDADHRELLDWVEEVEFDRVGVFAYSAEPGTPAGERADQVPLRIREARRDALLELQAGIHKRKMDALVGRTFDVLVDGPSEELPMLLEGRYYGQAPDIDGTVLLAIQDPDLVIEPGQMIRAPITAAADYDLVATLGA